MKGIIIFKSKYGVTRKYAEWLNSETGYPAIEIGKVKIKDIADADTIICGGPVLAHSIPVSKWIKKKWGILKNKKIVLYTTSGTSPRDPELRTIFESSFEPEISGNIKYFPQGGRMIFRELSRLDRILMKLGQLMEKDPKVRKEMVKDKDNIDRNGIIPILQYVI